MAIERVLSRNTRQELLRRSGRTPIFPFLEMQTWDYSRWFDDFTGDLFQGGAAPGLYQSTASGTASATAAIDTGVVNGAIKLVTGTDDDGYSDLSMGLHYRGDRGATIAVRYAISAITGYKIEIGFTDVLSGTDAGAVNALGASPPTWRATDAVVLCADTDAASGADYRFLGVKNGTAVTLANTIAPGLGAGWPGTASAAANEADYYQTVVVQLLDTSARFLIFDANLDITYESKWIDDAVTKTVLLTPWVWAQTRNTTSKTVDIDFIDVYQRRTTTN